jgi:hypothetical protein
MTRQTILGVLFLVVGLVVTGLALIPAVHGVAPSLVFLLTGIGVALFGAYLIPSSGAPVALTQLFVSLGTTNLPIVGGRRASDPAAPKDGM